MDKMKVLKFDQAGKEWLAYVVKNRQGLLPEDDWDVVIGPVANDQTYRTLALYLDGVVDEETTIKNLLTEKLSDQYTFKTQKAIALLDFIEVE